MSKNDIPKLYDDSEADQKNIIALLKSSGFSDGEIIPGVINYQITSQG